MLNSFTVDIGTTPTEVTTAPAGRWRYVYCRAPSGLTDDLFVGDADVTTTNGLKVAPDATSPVIRLPPGETLYGIAAASITIAVLESG